LHPTSLPGRFGIGSLGPSARSFVDFLARAGQGLWQVLPLGPTGYGDSPYQCFSAFAGNPLLIDPEELVSEGLLEGRDLSGAPSFPEDRVDFEALIAFKNGLLGRAFQTFASGRATGLRRSFEAFCREASPWLDDFGLFTALKESNGDRPWNTWEKAVARRDPGALEGARQRFGAEVESHKFRQFLFFRQWQALRSHCRSKGIRVMGDVPIFVAHDSADVWAHPELFRLRADGTPSHVAGVPPDYFSATGQLWGNPLYRWDALERTGFAWWVERLRATLGLFDLVRLDHFRGFEANWEVPGGDPTAERGRWAKVPGAKLLETVRAALGDLPMVAENLGYITPEVEALREQFRLPGMAILQFAWGPSGAGFRPHNYARDLVVYTGTHDNDTTVGWWTAPSGGGSTRTAAAVEAERELCRRYLATDGRAIHWDFIRAVLSSVADTAIVPMQDVLGLGSEARMNLPGRAHGNWRWRVSADALSPALAGRLKDLTVLYGRTPPAAPAPPR
jgi:4-alpha-glucanotransferase